MGCRGAEIPGLEDKMAFCTNCGAKLPEGAAFCINCGTKISEADQRPASAAVAEPSAVSEPCEEASEPAFLPDPEEMVRQALAEDELTEQNVQEKREAPEEEEKPQPESRADQVITTGGYIGIMLLNCIPVVNLVLLIIWACGGCRKTCKTNYARAVLILWGIGLLMAAVFLMVGFLVLGPDVMFDFWEAVAEAIRKL